MQDNELLSEYSTPDEDVLAGNQVIEETSLSVKDEPLDFLEHMIMRGNKTDFRFLQLDIVTSSVRLPS